MSEPTPRQVTTRALNPGVLERLRAHRVTTARFAFFEASDEWTLEDLTIAFEDGRVLDEWHADELEPGLRDALEDAPWQDGSDEAGYFEIDAAEGTITRLDDAFILELCCSLPAARGEPAPAGVRRQLDEATQAALTRAKVV